MLPKEFDIAGKIVFITGAGRGIGKGIATVLAEAGSDIALNALTPTYVEGVAAEIAKASGRRVVPIVADVTDPDQIRRAIDTVLQTFGRIDVLVNALGDSIRKPLAPLPGKENSGPALTDAELRFIMDINLTEALLCTRAVGPHMLARRSGKVINIASWAGHRGGGDMILYTTAKTALVGFTRAQALEWAPYNVHVNAISPGLYPRHGDRGRGAFCAGQPARRADRAAAPRRAAAGSRTARALSRLGRLRLHDGADHSARWRPIALVPAQGRQPEIQAGGVSTPLGARATSAASRRRAQSRRRVSNPVPAARWKS
jgi:NAD(P)-dependent dehydrogenase (short-subunit alcohol dehydrogenase family)